ncbi:efflux transporter outer membrane subunit [Maricaulis parjimensis]|uniref:efflux transporter outer membrane subunit n=1 Tax=Maricaulis parjimensis TaxID=144023 RepID=UPI001EEDB055|nr:efflux transporter outer membrane subunit [Maricaulis parjimensis]
MRKSLLVAATALVATSCASLPAYEPGDSLPAAPGAWSSAPASTGPYEAQDWVNSLDDAQLTSLIDEAFQSNPSLNQSFARYRAARAAARVAGANRLPSLNAGLDYTRREPNVGSGSDTFSLGLSAAWEADLWGRVADGANASARDAEAAAEDVRASQLSIAGLVAKQWYALTEAHLQTELAERDVATRQSFLSLTERRFARGLVRSSDVRTARSALASSEAALASRRRSEASTARALETLLGRYPAASLVSDGDFSELDPLTAIGSPEDILSRRPDVRAAERRLEAAGLRADAARKALYPSLSLSGGSGTGGPSAEDMLDLDTMVSSLTASLFGPIFNGGSLRAQREQAEANAEAQLQAYVSTVLTAWQEAENAIHADAILETRVASLRQAFEEAAEAEQLVIRQYASGVATIFDLLNAQSRRISAESQYISARRDRATNRVDLYLAIAGDFSAAQSADPAALTGE